MDIISRNFFRLLRAGAFGEEEQIEPMSAWKWQRAYQFSVMHGVTALLFDGICKLRNQFFLQIPPALMEQWKKTTKEIEQLNGQTNQKLSELFLLLGKLQLRPILLGGQGMATLYHHPLHRNSGAVEIFFPFETQGKKADQWAWDNGTNMKGHTQLSYEWEQIKVVHHHQLVHTANSLHGRTLHNLVEKEFRETSPSMFALGDLRIEQPSPTLHLLYLLLRISSSLLNNGLELNQLTDLGIFLRSAGDKVDFVKLQEWIERQGMKRMAQLIGALLIILLSFTQDEIPFMEEGKTANTDCVLAELFNLHQSHEWHFQQGNDIFVHTANTSAMFWQVRHSARYFRYYPSESVANFFSSFAHSLSHIEE